MRWVEKPTFTPGTCSVIPGRGPLKDSEWIDTGNELVGIDPRVYISGAGARKVAGFIGWKSPEELGRLEEALAASEAAVQALEAENAQLEGWMSAVDALESADFRARKKAGRPKKQEAS